MTEPNNIQTISENAHTKIIHQIIKYLDNCKESKTDCECSFVLKYNPNELNEFKKWSFLYQCDNVPNKINRVEKLTTSLLADIQDKKEEIYHVKK